MSIKPDAFRLLAGDDALSEYRFGSKQVRHLFCRHCGVRSFGRGDIPEWIGPYVSINLACLDDATPDELTQVPLRYMDGRHDNWYEAPADTRHL